MPSSKCVGCLEVLPDSHFFASSAQNSPLIGACWIAGCVDPLTSALFRQVRVELFDRRQTKFISAHASPLACLALSLDGRFLATASVKGTLVRVWSMADGALLQVRIHAGHMLSVYVAVKMINQAPWQVWPHHQTDG